jgi:hypothetical protein
MPKGQLGTVSVDLSCARDSIGAGVAAGIHAVSEAAIARAGTARRRSLQRQNATVHRPRNGAAHAPFACRASGRRASQISYMLIDGRTSHS